MEIKISDTPWFCPDCGSTLLNEECENVREQLNHECQIEFSCGKCGEKITADTTGCGGGVKLNPGWVYI